MNINKYNWQPAFESPIPCLVFNRLIAVLSRVVYIIDFVNMLGIARSSRKTNQKGVKEIGVLSITVMVACSHNSSVHETEAGGPLVLG